TLQICFGDFGAIDFARALLKTQYAAKHDTFRNAEPLAAQLAYSARNLPAVILLELVKAAREESYDCIQCFLFVFAVGNNAQIRTATGGKRQDAENRLRIGFGTAV